MKMESTEQIAESYINGNISWVKARVKKMSKVDFVRLLVAIQGMGNDSYDDYYTLAIKLTRN